MQRLMAVMAMAMLVSEPALADCRRVAVVNRQVSVEVASPFLATFFIPVQAGVNVPLYSAGYSSYFEPESVKVRGRCEDAMQTVLERLTSRLDEIERKLDGKQDGPDPPPPATVGKSSGMEPSKETAAVFVAKCATCHEGSVSKAKGAGLTLLNGTKAAALPRDVWTRVSAMAYSGDMPPAKSGVSLNDKEVAIIMADFLKVVKVKD